MPRKRPPKPVAPRWPRPADHFAVRYWLVMPAAGTGRRFGGETPKQYLQLSGACVIEHALAPFLADARCQGIVIAVDAADRWIGALRSVSADSRVQFVTGGQRRCDSVHRALDAIAGESSDWVLVHDAARPCLRAADLDRLIDELQEDPVGGLLAVPLTDTLKRTAVDTGSGADGAPVRVVETPARSGIWRALTPQMFRLGTLRRALDSAEESRREPTDESQAIEWLGHAPRLVAGSAGNIKITTAADLRLAAAWLAQEKQ
jgi:2-C-methyl-D-erythritol 4-phosphate cytidylyltransferase